MTIPVAGDNFVLDWPKTSEDPIISLETLTFAGNLETLASLQVDVSHTFVQGCMGGPFAGGPSSGRAPAPRRGELCGRELCRPLD